MEKIQNKPRVCHKCGKKYTSSPAISRVDNATPIRPECGAREALEAWVCQKKRLKR